jgi:isopenicillin N synthase-like dioxygenase
MKTETGEADRCEFFMVLQDELNDPDLDPGILYPSPIRSNLDYLKDYLSHAQSILAVICERLSISFELDPSTFGSLQHPSSPSGTMIRMIRYPAASTDADRRTALLPHTDMGTVTLLASVLGALQILPPGSEDKPDNWQYLKPEQNCLIVNMGDAMVQWTGGVLRSNLHRVTYAPGEQGSFDRYSVAYLVRAAKNADMKRLVGGLIPDLQDGEDEVDCSASEWERKKSMALAAGKDCARSTGGRPLRLKI